MAGNVLVLAEHWRGQLSEITYEVLALGRELADALEGRLEASVLGRGQREISRGLGKADSVLYVDHPDLAEPVAETWSEALYQLVKERQPAAVLIPLTNVTLAVGTLLAAKMQAPGINFCKDVRVVDGAIQATCILYGGKMEARVLTAHRPAVLGIWPGSRPAELGRATGAPPVEEITVTFPAPARIRFLHYIEPEAGDVDITQQPVLVGVGRGIQAKDNLALAEELASVLRGAVCGSRPVIDQGWLSLSRQVGKSGAIVKPRLYVAAGISGAPEHVEGMRNSSMIVAINTDPQAPIFHVAHYGIVADALDILPALTEAIRARKG